MVGALSNNYNYYAGSYTSGATLGAARTAAVSGNSALPVTPVSPVAEVYSNADTRRVRSVQEREAEVSNAAKIMNSLSTRSAANLNGPLEFGKVLSDARVGSIPKEEEKPVLPFESGEKEITIKPGRVDPSECETCKNRKYVDGSNENDVSFKTPGHIDPGASAAVVASHEYEHVANARQKGNEENTELVSATVTLKTSVCPECGRVYCSGGETRTIIRYNVPEEEFPVEEENEEETGKVA
ncbi:MAG: hypothetical protein K6B75_05725 [Lachnospiraceae bacterium]|nr:hypothetical protein [Lachnospiraceae bacterium]